MRSQPYRSLLKPQAPPYVSSMVAFALFRRVAGFRPCTCLSGIGVRHAEADRGRGRQARFNASELDVVASAPFPVLPGEFPCGERRGVSAPGSPGRAVRLIAQGPGHGVRCLVVREGLAGCLTSVQSRRTQGGVLPSASRCLGHDAGMTAGAMRTSRQSRKQRNQSRSGPAFLWGSPPP